MLADSATWWLRLVPHGNVFKNKKVKFVFFFNLAVQGFCAKYEYMK